MMLAAQARTATATTNTRAADAHASRRLIRGGSSASVVALDRADGVEGQPRGTTVGRWHREDRRADPGRPRLAEEHRPQGPRRVVALDDQPARPIGPGNGFDRLDRVIRGDNAASPREVLEARGI